MAGAMQVRCGLGAPVGRATLWRVRHTLSRADVLLRAALVLVVCALALPAASAEAGGPLETAFLPAESLEGTGGDLQLARARNAGASVIRMFLLWRNVAPAGEQRRRPQFEAGDHTDPAYNWAAYDQQISAIVAAGLKPLVTIHSAPQWAYPVDAEINPVAYRPDAGELGVFARAAAQRYSGRVEGLPRVQLWQAWNEPNISIMLRPQLVGGRPVSPALYRAMLNAIANGVKSVHASNVVVAGGTAPFRDITPEVQAQNKRWGPLTFMRELLCLSRELRPTCRQRVRFDVWSHHPYTSGGPTHEAQLPDDASLGDLPEVRRVLEAAVGAGHVRSRGKPRFWVTEFSWDSRPPDPNGVPTALHTRWVAEALYRMWLNGVSLVTWFSIRDQPLGTSYLQSGLFYRGATVAKDRPKPALRAFRFPFVAFVERERVRVWGRTPGSSPDRVVVEQSFSGGWKRLGILRAGRNGIFGRVFRTGTRGSVRARLADGTDSAVPFSLKPVPDRFFTPFGAVDLEP